VSSTITSSTAPLPALDRSASVPLWMQFRDALRSRILQGHFTVGAKLPTEAEFGEQFGISRIVVREALADLVRSGLIYKIRGQGAFVSTPERDEDFVSSSTLTGLSAPDTGSGSLRNSTDLGTL
jgi:GntR family transcriptional regulator